MKRTLSLILAIAASMSMAVTAFANTAVESKMTDGITFEKDANDIDLNNDVLLVPGKEYKFPISITIDGKKETLNDDHLKSYSFRVENESGKTALDFFKIQKVDGKHVLNIKVKAGWPTKQTDVEYKVKLVNKADGKSISTHEVAFRTGYEFASDNAIADLKEGDTVHVDANRPVYSQKQLEKIAELNNYKKVTFTNGTWTYTASINDMGAVNFLNNESAIKEIITKYEDNDFKFVSFPGGPEFGSKGQVSIDVSDIEEDFDGKFFVYRYLNGKLSKIDAKFIADDSAITFDTTTLGRFVITDKEIKDGSIVADTTDKPSSSKPETDKPSTDKPSTDKPSTDGSNKPNPETGTNNAVGVAVAMAAIALVAGAVSMKKSK